MNKKSILQFLFLLQTLSSCIIANKLEWRQTDVAMVSGVKKNPTNPDLHINFARCENELTILPFFFIWDNNKTGYSLSLNISTGTDIYQKLDSIEYEIFTEDRILTKGNLRLESYFQNRVYENYNQYFIEEAKTDYYIKAEHIQGDLIVNLTLYLTRKNGDKISLKYPNEKLRRNKWKRFQFFVV